MCTPGSHFSRPCFGSWGRDMARDSLGMLLLWTRSPVVGLVHKQFFRYCSLGVQARAGFLLGADVQVRF